MVQSLETNLENYQTKASQREDLEKETTQMQETIKTILNEIQELDDEKNQFIAEYNIDLTIEDELRTQNEESKKYFAQLETEKSERENDVKEFTVTMEENFELRQKPTTCEPK